MEGDLIEGHTHCASFFSFVTVVKQMSADMPLSIVHLNFFSISMNVNKRSADNVKRHYLVIGQWFSKVHQREI